MVRVTLRTVAAAVLTLVAVTPAASAQITTGTVTGLIKDGQGSIVPGATVTLVNTGRGTTTEAQTSSDGTFVFPNVTAGTYMLRVTMDGFKTLQRPNVVVSPGDRVLVPDLTIDVGSLNETVTVTAESPMLQASSGERSYSVATEAVENLPLADRNFATLASLAPGVTGTSRIGDRSSSGGGNNNFMVDGVSTMDTGSNRLLTAVNVESISEVKVLVSSYQAEYGRSSGIQITAVTKGGTNRFRGSLYDVERNSDWNSNSKVNKLNGDVKAITKQREWGYSIGGPVGKPGGNNKLFFFYAHEYQPRTGGNDAARYRMPTALERQGDFSQTIDNNGNRYNLIRDTATGLPCTSTDTRGCFQDGDVLGRIPQSRLYQPGVNILKMYPLPNLPADPGNPYNYEFNRPAESILAFQPAIRLDYQPTKKLRGAIKYTGWSQRKQTINGSIPGFNDTRMQNPVVNLLSMTVNYNLSSRMFLEGTFGRSGNDQAGCALQGVPNFCTAALPMNPSSNRINAGLGSLPFLFPNANVLNPDYYAFGVMADVQPPIWDGTRLQMPPNFTWGSRVSNNNPQYGPPNIPFPGFLNVNRTRDLSISLTKLAGRHTIKTGFYNTHSWKAQQRGGWNGTITFSNDNNNPLDSTFGFANAALGIMSSYNQASSYVEGQFVYDNVEGYVQDNWKVNRRLTLDYGLRFVHQQPQYDSLGQASNFLPEKWNISQAPMLFVAGCANGVSPCTGTNRQALNPLTGQFLGPNSILAIGTIVPNTGDTLNGLFLSGQGIAKTTYTWPALGVAPRLGMAYDLTGKQQIVLRGGAGLFFDRPSGNSIYSQVQNPPVYKSVTIRNGQLQTLGNGGLTTDGVPALNVFKYDSHLPASWQWNGGVQLLLPWATALGLEYVGQHGFHIVEDVNLNAVDLGSAFLPQNQDLTLTPSATPGATAISQDQMRALRGYGSITQQWDRGWITHHSLQLSLNRRFRNGVSFGFNDTIVLASSGSTDARLQHNPDGSFSFRADQGDADRLLGRAIDRRHVMKANFVWDLPDLESTQPAIRAVGLLVNDWRFSGIWTGMTGNNYTIGYSYQSGGSSVNITGSQDYNIARVRIVGDPGNGCSDDVYHQFNTAAFQGPLTGSVGLESGNDYLRGCFSSVLDLSIARNIRVDGGRQLTLRVDLFNAPNSAIITGRQTTMNLANPTDPVTVTNPAFDANGNLIESRSRPRGAGFGVANNYQAPRSVQVQVRFSF
jgi:Carboxypeptidase regulatory-like domain